MTDRWLTIPNVLAGSRGAKNIAKEKARNNPVIQSYVKAYRRITADKSRGNITEHEWKIAKKKCHRFDCPQFKEDLISVGDITVRQLWRS